MGAAVVADDVGFHDRVRVEETMETEATARPTANNGVIRDMTYQLDGVQCWSCGYDTFILLRPGWWRCYQCLAITTTEEER